MADWNDHARDAIIFGVGSIPEVGALAGFLLDNFWPASGENVWEEVREQVEAMINQKIDDLVYELVNNELESLKTTLSAYVNQVQSTTGTDAQRSDAWSNASAQFDHSRSKFTMADHESALLPLFAQFGNLHLALLRDGLAKSDVWSLDAGLLKRRLGHITGNAPDATLKGELNYVQWVEDHVKGPLDTAWAAGADAHAIEPFRSANAVQRGFDLYVRAYSDVWKYFDDQAWPKPLAFPAISPREVFSDPCGSGDNSGIRQRPDPQAKPKGLPIGVKCWASTGVVGALQVDYAAGQGPSGKDSTGPMGWVVGDGPDPKTLLPPGGFAKRPPQGNPIAKVRMFSGNVVESLELVLRDGSTLALGGNPARERFELSYPGRVLSSLSVGGGSSPIYCAADSIVAGFVCDPDHPLTDPTALASGMFRTHPSLTLQALSNALAPHGVDPSALAALAHEQGWEARRALTQSARVAWASQAPS